MNSKFIYEKLFLEKETDAPTLEREAELGDKTVSKAIKRGTNISLATANKITALYPDVRKEWLTTGEGEMLHEEAMYSNDNSTLIINRKKHFTAPMTEVVYNPEVINDVVDRISTYAAVNDRGQLEMGAKSFYHDGYWVPHYLRIPLEALSVEDGFNLSRAPVPDNYYRYAQTRADFSITYTPPNMMPRYMPGSMVGLQCLSKDDVHFGYAYLVVFSSDISFIHIIQPGKDDHHWMLENENPAFKSKEWPLSKIKHICMVKASGHQEAI